MQINLPKFGSGVPAIFNGSPIKVPPASGKLRMAGGNVAQSGVGVRQDVQQFNQTIAHYAKSPKGNVNIKA